MAELVQGQSAPVGMKAEGFVDALHRVRQIAAKIDSVPHLNNSTPLVDPSVYGYGAQKRPLDDGVGNQLGALVHQRAVITEEFKVPDKMVGFIIGRGGEQISRIQAESGCKIQIASESSGIPERPCVLTGTPESIEQAKRLLGQIVDRCRNGPGFHNDIDGNSTIQEILIPASKVGLVIGKGGETIKQLQERTGVKMVMIQDGPLPTGADKPLRITGDPFKVQQAREMVLEIIREKDQADFRGVRGDFSARVGGGSIEVSVPRFAVGIVIGRNGEMIKKIQNDAGVRIQFKPDDGISPERAAQVMGPPDRCQHAAHIINELILTAQLDCEVPRLPSAVSADGRVGGLLATQERDGFGGLAVARGRGRGRGDWSVGAPGGVQEITYPVPADKCGLVIGKGGENIKSINQQSGAHVELQRNPPPNTDPNLRIFTIRGIPQQIEVARHLIDEKVGGTSLGAPGAFGQSPFSQPPAAPHQNTFPPRSSGCFPSIAAKVNGNPHSTPVSGPPAFLTQGWGSTYQAWQQPTQQVPSQQSQPPSSQPDYSKAWEDYYKKQSHAASAAPQASSPPDYTMAWAEYYRQQVAFYGQTLGQAQAHSQEQ
ncbi:far upstream element-binding protein 3 isoform X1 [Callorhinus ursinus]|uniref:Far upstream element-binding protein 3 isoform X1 n=1 Tax=Callorhinus ursinus TaxID=34884 RepID=A0A3Q7QE16_CALUR|nr:far upstream element-binding protein 3 isoform X1 [Callorhinus ursinus]XP_027946313.1 far upstream element-binding protein 3 isoform X1 [Eumetopias jubatus]